MILRGRDIPSEFAEEGDGQVKVILRAGGRIK